MAGFLLLCLLAAAVLTGLYLLLYTFVINRRLARKGADGAARRRLASPGTVLVALLVVALLVWGIWSATGERADRGLPEQYASAAYDLQILSSDQMQTDYRSAFSIEENPGYEKTVVEDGPVRFTLFQSAAGYDRMHPMVVLYADYTGDMALDTVGYSAHFLTLEGQEIEGYFAAGGQDVQDVRCFFASADTACILRLEMDYLDAQGAQRLKEEGYEKGVTPELLRTCAAATGTLELVLAP